MALVMYETLDDLVTNRQLGWKRMHLREELWVVYILIMGWTTLVTGTYLGGRSSIFGNILRYSSGPLLHPYREGRLQYAYMGTEHRNGPMAMNPRDFRYVPRS
jgi:hypothetical protein